MKAQFAMEYFFIITFLLAIILPMLTYSYISTSKLINENKAINFVKLISSEMSYLYSKGPGAKTTIRFDAPSGIDISKSKISGNTVTIYVLGKEYSRDLYVNVSSDIPLRGGEHEIEITYLDSGYIMVGNAKVLAPAYFSKDVSRLGSYFETFNITNIYSESISDIQIETEGPSFISVFPLSYSDAAAGEVLEAEFRVISPADDGEYTGFIKIKEDDIIMRVIPYTVNVS